MVFLTYKLFLLFFATTANPLCICWNTWFYVKFQVIYDYIQCKKFSRTWKLTISQFNCSLKGESKKHRLQLSFIKILTRSGVTMTIVKAILWLIVNFWQKCKRFRLKYKRQNVDLLLEVTLETSEDIGHIWILILSIFFSLNFWIFSIVSEIYLEIWVRELRVKVDISSDVCIHSSACSMIGKSHQSTVW